MNLTIFSHILMSTKTCFRDNHGQMVMIPQITQCIAHADRINMPVPIRHFYVWISGQRIFARQVGIYEFTLDPGFIQTNFLLIAVIRCHSHIRPIAVNRDKIDFRLANQFHVSGTNVRINIIFFPVIFYETAVLAEYI